MYDLLSLFKDKVQQENLFRPGQLLILAVSGGVDSVVLCELCHLAGYPFVIAHCNFQLRESESERDQRFVAQLAGKYNVRLFEKQFETEAFASQNKVSIQVAARMLRYQWFDQLADIVASETGQKVLVATAHHADDNLETVLMNFFKGTGIAGMRGILPVTGRIVRPLLWVRKKSLLAFAVQRGLHFVEDSSNASDKYTRNYLRHHIVPLIEEKYPGAEEQILGSIQRFREVETLYMQAIAVHKKRLVEQRGNEFFLPVRKLIKTEPLASVIYELVKDFGFSPKQTAEVIGLLYAASGKMVSSSTHRILRNRDWLIISPLPQNNASVIVISKEVGELDFEAGKLVLEEMDITEGIANIPEISSIALLDNREIRFPLLLRKWKPGDYFYPLGMGKKKKLARFFIDRKLSLNEKEKIWVLEMDKKILWVLNQRIDHRFRITETTKSVLQVKLIPVNTGH